MALLEAVDKMVVINTTLDPGRSGNEVKKYPSWWVPLRACEELTSTSDADTSSADA